MRITRLGRVFAAEDGPDWMVSHAAYPVPVRIAADRLRVFFNTRDAMNRGAAAWVDVDAANPRRILRVADTPCLVPGSPGAFDDRGISNGSIAVVGGTPWLYYMGWNKSADVPFRNAIGLAVCDSPGCGPNPMFNRRFEGPLVDRSRHDPFTLSYPFVTPPPIGPIGKGGRTAAEPWRMIYGTSRGGGTVEADMRHTLTEATSPDGIDWRPTGLDIMPLEAGDYGISRPWLFESGGRRYLMFSIRRQTYSIGLAVQDTPSGPWRRVANDLLGPAPDGPNAAGDHDWERGATCYASTIKVADQRYLFYCGREYGRTGFGVATLGA
jgi:hypothetical protein